MEGIQLLLRAASGLPLVTVGSPRSNGPRHSAPAAAPQSNVDRYFEQCMQLFRSGDIPKIKVLSEPVISSGSLKSRYTVFNVAWRLFERGRHHKISSDMIEMFLRKGQREDLEGFVRVLLINEPKNKSAYTFAAFAIRHVISFETSTWVFELHDGKFTHEIKGRLAMMLPGGNDTDALCVWMKAQISMGEPAMRYASDFANGLDLHGHCVSALMMRKGLLKKVGEYLRSDDRSDLWRRANICLASLLKARQFCNVRLFLMTLGADIVPRVEAVGLAKLALRDECVDAALAAADLALTLVDVAGSSGDMVQIFKGVVAFACGPQADDVGEAPMTDLAKQIQLLGIIVSTKPSDIQLMTPSLSTLIASSNFELNRSAVFILMSAVDQPEYLRCTPLHTFVAQKGMQLARKEGVLAFGLAKALGNKMEKVGASQGPALLSALDKMNCENGRGV